MKFSFIGKAYLWNKFDDPLGDEEDSIVDPPIGPLTHHISQIGSDLLEGLGLLVHLKPNQPNFVEFSWKEAQNMQFQSKKCGMKADNSSLLGFLEVSS